MKLRVVTWNVWFGEWNAARRQEALWAELARLEPDVICLQEMTQEHLDRPELHARRFGGEWISDAHINGYDVITLARVPVRRSERLPLVSVMGRNLLVTRLDIDPPLTVATVHLESTAPMTEYRVRQLNDINSFLAAEPDVLLVGDMNFADGSRPEESAITGWRDAWRELRPDEPGYTLDSERNKMRGWTKPGTKRARLDRALLQSERWRFTEIERLGTQALPEDPLTHISDHFGLLLELESAE